MKNAFISRLKSFVLKALFSAMLLSVSGCMTAVTDCRGQLAVRDGVEGEGRFVVVTFWQYPTVNLWQGRFVLDDIIVLDERTAAIEYDAKAYLVVWTPAMGTQHLAPDPGVAVFRQGCFPAWNVGGTGINRRYCCEKPSSEQAFVLQMACSEDKFLEGTNREIFDLDVLEKLNANEAKLLKKLNRCKQLTEQEKQLVIDQIENTLALF